MNNPTWWALLLPQTGNIVESIFGGKVVKQQFGLQQDFLKAFLPALALMGLFLALKK